MSVKLITAPAVEPVSLTEAKQHLRVWDDSEDGYISSLIVSARMWCETVIRRSLTTTTWQQTLGCFPSSGVIDLQKPSLQSVTSVAYTDSDGNSATLATTEYEVDTDSVPGRVLRGYGKSWPTVRTTGTAAPVTITFVAGYGDNRSDVPETVRQAMLLAIGHWYESREMVAEKPGSVVPQAASSLLATECWGHYP